MLRQRCMKVAAVLLQMRNCVAAKLWQRPLTSNEVVHALFLVVSCSLTTSDIQDWRSDQFYAELRPRC